MNSTISNLTWKDALAEQKQMPYFQAILAQLARCKQQGITVYPSHHDIFNALRYTPILDVKVVILGQDPYHGPQQAHGLCFSVCKGITPPPSLKNIFKELHSDLNIPAPKHGNLTKWARQGVLLLNSVLSVQASQPQSHASIGWETFTDKVIQVVNDSKDGVVFLLWGSSAQKKCQHIDRNKHFVLRTTHPSPLAANHGFLGCRHFSKTNTILERLGKQPIDWSLD